MSPQANTCAECGAAITPKSTICWRCRNRHNIPLMVEARWGKIRADRASDPGPNPSGLCMCGCGRPAPIAKQTNRAKGHVQGKPHRFIAGHCNRKRVQWVVDPETGCWNFTGSVSKDGYGRRSFDGKMTTAHRSVYEQLRGPIPDGLDLDHLCRNRRCVNPDHLEPVTRRVNVMRGKRMKFSDDVAAEIAGLLGEGVHYREIADRFGCDPDYVYGLAQRHRRRATD